MIVMPNPLGNSPFQFPGIIIALQLHHYAKNVGSMARGPSTINNKFRLFFYSKTTPKKIVSFIFLFFPPFSRERERA
jgi:hypothetical protein